MYVDGNGDPGLIANSPSRYFVLSGLVTHEAYWQEGFRRLVMFRRNLKQNYGLPLGEEIHAGESLRKPGLIKRNEWIAIFRAFARELATMTELRIINVVVDKQGKDASYMIFDKAWAALAQRFDQVIAVGGFPISSNGDKGMIFSDETDWLRVTRLLRYARLHHVLAGPYHPNAVNQRGSLANLIEDPSFRDSVQSYYVQAADVASFLLYQRLVPNKHMRQKGRRYNFYELNPILCRVAAQDDADGIT